MSGWGVRGGSERHWGIPSAGRGERSRSAPTGGSQPCPGWGEALQAVGWASLPAETRRGSGALANGSQRDFWSVFPPLSAAPAIPAPVIAGRDLPVNDTGGSGGARGGWPGARGIAGATGGAGRWLFLAGPVCASERTSIALRNSHHREEAKLPAAGKGLSPPPSPGPRGSGEGDGGSLGFRALRGGGTLPWRGGTPMPPGLRLPTAQPTGGTSWTCHHWVGPPNGHPCRSPPPGVFWGGFFVFHGGVVGRSPRCRVGKRGFIVLWDGGVRLSGGEGREGRVPR